MILEIDARSIQGDGGEVCWQLVDGTHFVTVTDGEGTVHARLQAADGGAARELFEHPFARAAVPNLFDRRSPQ